MLSKSQIGRGKNGQSSLSLQNATITSNLCGTKRDTGSEIAGFLENEVNTMASKGWEFYRIDQVGVLVNPGCLAALAGTKQSMTYYNIAIFRRLIGTHNYYEISRDAGMKT